MQSDASVTRVRVWLTNLVTRFREKYEELTEPEKKQIPNSDNYRAPCQLEVFWIEEPEFQFLVITHSFSRNDLDIIVNGPHKAYQFLERTERILGEPRWREIPPPEGSIRYADTDLTYADLFASYVHSGIEQIKNSIFSKIETPLRLGGMIFGYAGWVWMFHGNMSELDYMQIVDDTIKDIRRRAKETQQGPREEKPFPLRLKGFGTYFFPPIWIGEFPKPTLGDRLQGRVDSRHFFPWSKNEFVCPFKDYRIGFRN